MFVKLVFLRNKMSHDYVHAQSALCRLCVIYYLSSTMWTNTMVVTPPARPRWRVSWSPKRELWRTVYWNHNGAILHCGSKNAPTLADYNYDPVQSILIIYSKLFVSDHKSCLVVKFSTSPHICCHYTLWNTIFYSTFLSQLHAHGTVCRSLWHLRRHYWRSGGSWRQRCSTAPTSDSSLTTICFCFFAWHCNVPL